MKVLLLGNPKSGKTRTITKLVLDRAINSYRPTIGFDEWKLRRYSICDFAGQARWRYTKYDDFLKSTYERHYMKRAQVAIIFEGGDEIYPPNYWETLAKLSNPNIKISYISGNPEEKLNQLQSVLA